MKLRKADEMEKYQSDQSADLVLIQFFYQW
jgi:hypothetical protein